VKFLYKALSIRLNFLGGGLAD